MRLNHGTRPGGRVFAFPDLIFWGEYSMLRRLFMVGLAVIGMGFLLSPQVDGATLPRNLIFISGGGSRHLFS